MYELKDRFVALPCDWYFYLNEHSRGKAIHFQVKAKFKFIVGKLEKASRMTIEEITLSFVKRACRISN